MTALDDLLLDVPPIESEADFLEAFADPNLRWWALRRRQALTAAGLLGASAFELLHPRGNDGKFIKKWSIVRWFDSGEFVWRQGIVRDIDTDSGQITVVNGKGETHTFSNPKSLVSRPTPKAALILPSPGTGKDAPGFKKVGNQGGSNPGGFYEVIDANAAVPGASGQDPSPDISAAHRMAPPMRLIAESQLVVQVGVIHDATVAQLATGMEGTTVMVPRIDGTPHRYDVVTKIGSQWFRIPAKGSLTNDDGTPRSDLLVTEQAIFGDPDTPRRAQLVNDQIGMLQFIRRADITPDNLASTIQEAASAPAVVGDKFYVKTMKTPERVRNEALANDLYEMLGVAVPEVTVGEDGLTLASKLIGAKVDFDPGNQDHRKAAQQAFVADAWLANWDAVGQGYDNMQVAPDGTVWRVDAGGALKYRAMESSGPKGQMFGPEVGELDSLRNPQINPSAAAVYGGIPQDELVRQGELLRAVSPAQISELADRWDMPDVADTLIARRQSILDQLGIGPPEVSEEGNPLYPGMTPAEIHQKLTKPPGPSVYNPVEQTVQPGTPPKVAVHNYEVALNDLDKTTLNSTDISDPSLMQNAVIVQHGGLWVYVEGYKDQGAYGEMTARNIVTDEQMRINVYPGDQALSKYVNHPGALTEPIDDLADDMKVKWDLAVAEVATESMAFDTPSAAFNNHAWIDSWPEYLTPVQMPVYHIDEIASRIKSGDLSEDGPLYNAYNGKVYEIEMLAAPLEGQVEPNIILRESGSADGVVLTNTGFQDIGPWFMPMNDTGEAVYRARLQAAVVEPTVETKDGHAAKAGDTVIFSGMTYTVQEVYPATDSMLIHNPGMGSPFEVNGQQVSTPGQANTDAETTQEILDLLQPVGDSYAATSPFTESAYIPATKASMWEKLGQAHDNPASTYAEKVEATAEYSKWETAYSNGDPLPATPTIDKYSNTGKLKVADPELEALLNEEQSIADKAVAAAVVEAAPTVPQQIDPDSHILTSLGPGKPMYTGNMSPEPENWPELVGMNVVVLSKEAYEAPEANVKLSSQNGLMRITAVNKYGLHSMKIHGVKGDGSTMSVLVGGWEKRYLVPVTANVEAMPLTMSGDGYKTGTMKSGSRNIGKWYRKYAESTALEWGQTFPYVGATHKNYWRGVINADESVTGEVVVVYGSTKSEMKEAVFGMLRPVPQKPKKPKKVAAALTEADIVKLKQSYVEKFTPSVTVQVTAEMQAAHPAIPVGQQPLASGGMPVVGQWVYSPKDNTYWQVSQTDPKLTGKVPGTNIRVKRAGAWSVSLGKYKTVESFRGRSTMYAVEGEGKQPTTFLATNAVTLSDGGKAGPGMYVWWPKDPTGALGVRIVETKDGKVKIVTNADGSTHWVDPSALNSSGSVHDADVKVVTPYTEEGLAAAIDAAVYATVNEQVAVAIANDLAAPTPKKPKKGPLTYPGPDGTLVKQNPLNVENHVKKGQALLSDGYAPELGMVLRDKKGQRWVIIEIPGEWKSNKNSVKVIPQGSSVDWQSGKWRANSTMVVDHEAMLTDKNGKALPRLGDVSYPHMENPIPDGSVIFRSESEVQGKWDPVTKAYRTHVVARYYAVPPNTGGYVSSVISLATGKSVKPKASMYVNGTRVAVVDHAAGDQLLTITTGPFPDKPNAKLVTGFVIHNLGEDPTALLAGQSAPKSGIGVPVAPDVTPPAPTPIKVGDQVQFSDYEYPVTVLEVLPGDKVVLDTKDGSTITTGVTDMVSPWVFDASLTTKDGQEVFVGMQAKWNDATVTITGVIPHSGQVTVDINGSEGKTFPEQLSSLPGISPPPTDPLPVPTFPHATLNDGSVINVGDTITVNGDEAKVNTVQLWTGDHGEAGYKLGVTPTGQPDYVTTYVYTDKDVISSGQGSGATWDVGLGPGVVLPAPPGGTVVTPEATPSPVPTTPPPPPPEPTGVGLTGDLPPFVGDVGGELPHPAQSASGVTIQAPQVTGAGADLADSGALKTTATNSVMTGWAEAQERVKQNKANGTQQSSVAYGIGDGDVVEDMLFHTQVLRDKSGGERTEITFTLTPKAARKVRGQLLVKGGSTYGDWSTEQVDPKLLVPGDQISLRKSQEKNGVLKPAMDNFPNTVITTAPVLIGNATEPASIVGLPVYRAEVAFNNGNTGVIELVSGHSKPFYRYQWDPTKVKSTNGNVGLNPAAAVDGWSLAATGMSYPAGSEKSDGTTLFADQAKQLPTGGVMSTSGSGMQLRRNLNGAAISYWTTPDRNTLDGRVTISIDSDDPNAQAKISAAMEAVGVPVEAQTPPSAEKLAKMALDKVYTQFNPTYTRGETSNAAADNPAQVLGLVETAIGKQLREVTGDPNRHVTLDDISLRVDPDGRVQVLLSHDVAAAISKRNGAVTYTHLYYGGADAVFSSLANTPGLLSTNERWSSGVWATGQSSDGDHTRNSAQYLFTRPYKHAQMNASTRWYMVTPADTVHRLTDTYYNEDDGWGARGGDNQKWLNLPKTGEDQAETMVKKRFENELFGRILAPNETARQDMIKRLKDWGRPKAPNGADWEDFIVAGSLDSASVAEPDFGEEIPLSGLLAGSAA